MKELIFDIETSPNLAYVWAKYEQDVISFEKEREVIAFSCKWAGEKKVYSYSLKDLKPKELSIKLRDFFNEADILIAHNGDNFDVKMANTSFAHHSLTPPSPYKTIDTLKIARSKFKFNSNKLDDLGEYLGLGRKVETGGFKLWLGCLSGNKRSWNKMVKYNRQDVILLGKVYLKLRPWATNLPQNSEGLTCPACGSTNVQRRGFNINKVFKSQRYQCRSCGKWSSSSKKIKYNNNEYLK
jgi:ribosomal protein L37AE/L43A